MYSPDEVLNEIFADPNSDLDENSSEEEYEGESFPEEKTTSKGLKVMCIACDNNQLQ